MIALAKRMKISRKLQLLGLLFVLGYVGLGACAYSLVGAVKINGPLYKTIVDGKDLVAEVMPPPQSLIEPYLLVLEMVDETDATTLAALAEQSKKLRTTYEARHRFWEERLPDGDVKAKLVADSYKPGITFLHLVDAEFVPAMLRGDWETARRLADGPLKDAYAQHRRAIDEVVKLAIQQSAQGETRAAELTRLREGILWVLGVAMLVLVWALGRLLADGIVGPLQHTVEVLEDVASGDLTARLDVTSEDELGQMATALNRALVEMQSTMQGSAATPTRWPTPRRSSRRSATS